MNSYNLYEEEHYSMVLYHAVAKDEEHVKILAEEAGMDIEGLVIDLQSTNVKDQLGRPYKPYIEEAVVR